MYVYKDGKRIEQWILYDAFIVGGALEFDQNCFYSNTPENPRSDEMSGKSY